MLLKCFGFFLYMLGFLYPGLTLKQEVSHIISYPRDLNQLVLLYSKYIADLLEMHTTSMTPEIFDINLQKKHHVEYLDLVATLISKWRRILIRLSSN